MLGFLFGVGLTVFLIRRLGGGPLLGRGGFRSRGGSRRRRTRRREWILNRLSDRLDTSPAQDRVLEEVVDDLMDVFAEHRGAFSAARSTLADALTGDAFDGAAFDELRKQQEAAFGEVHGAARAALGKLFDVLEPDQREALADLVSRGPRGHHCHGRRRHLHAA